MDTIKLGQLVKVENTDRKPTAGKTYHLVYLEDDSTKAYLFTKTELNRASVRTEKNPEDVIPLKTPGFWARLFGR